MLAVVLGIMLKNLMCVISFKHPNNTPRQVLPFHPFVDKETEAQGKNLVQVPITREQQR